MGIMLSLCFFSESDGSKVAFLAALVKMRPFGLPVKL